MEHLIDLYLIPTLRFNNDVVTRTKAKVKTRSTDRYLKQCIENDKNKMQSVQPAGFRLGWRIHKKVSIVEEFSRFANDFQWKLQNTILANFSESFKRL